MTVRYVASSTIPTQWGIFDMHGFEEDATGKEHVVMSMGDIGDGEPVLMRIHSECLTGDALFSQRCDCGSQLAAAMQAIAKEKRGAVFYLRQEGRGIGLINKIKAYHLQDQGADTVEANQRLGFEADMRNYDMLSPMLSHLNIHQARLMTNNPRKVAAMERYGVNVVERLPIETGRNPYNEHYLNTKSGKLGHLF